MTPIILFGSVPLASWSAAQILDHPRLSLAGVVCDCSGKTFAHHGLDHPPVFEFAKDRGIPVVDLDTLPAWTLKHCDGLGLSVRFSEIISADLLAAFKNGVLNLHGGPLPSHRGVDIANHLILEGATTGGGTLHFLDAGIDTGPVVDRSTFEIANGDTAYDVFQKTQRALMGLLARNLDAIAAGKLEAVPQADLIAQGEVAHTYAKADILAFQEIALDMPTDEIDRRVRAFEFEGHEPAYFHIDKRRYFVTTALGDR